jgi:alpha-1,4-galacturonosyltransferase
VLHAVHVGGAILESQAPHRELKAYRPLQDNNLQEVYASSAAAVHYDPDLKDVNIVATYSDHYGNIRLGRVKMGDLSPSWVLENPAYQVSRKTKGSQLVIPRDSFQNDTGMEDNASHSTTNQTDESENQFPNVDFASPAKLKRQVICQIAFFSNLWMP